jgi:hypothetical protein
VPAEGREERTMTLDAELMASLAVLASFGGGALLRGVLMLRTFRAASTERKAVEASATPAPRLAA